MSKKLIIFGSLLSLLLAIAKPLPAQTSDDDIGTLTLEQCISIAQDQSPVANAARYALIASKWENKSFNADLLPSLSLDRKSTRLNSSHVSISYAVFC